jgi:serine/threonine protein kinase
VKVKAPSLSPGGMLASRWIIGGLLGRSELAEVYEAEEAREGRFAAFKLLRPEFGAEGPWQAHVARLKALSELPGDGIARTYDAGIEPALKRPYIASERLTFPTLARYVQERGAMPLRALAAALETLALALDTAHAAGFIHGNLKPQNIFVSFDHPQWARITDFALCQLRTATGTGPPSLLGWSAPEIAHSPPTPESDRYSLALVCFFAATGSPWYSALRYGDGVSPESDRPSHVASARARAFGGELEPEFDPWFTRALATDPSSRFGSAVEMARSFSELLSGSLHPPPPSSVHPLSATRPIPESQIPKPPEVPEPVLASRPFVPDLPSSPSAFDAMASAPVARVGSLDLAATQPDGSERAQASSVPPPSLTAPRWSPPPPRSSLPPARVVARTVGFQLAAAAIVALAILAMWWALR